MIMSLTTTGQWIGAIALIILFISTFFILVMIKKKSTQPLHDVSFMSDVITALGGKDNLISASTLHQRIKINIEDPKKIDAKHLTELKLGAFLKGKEVTLMIRNHIDQLVSIINEQRKED